MHQINKLKMSDLKMDDENSDIETARERDHESDEDTEDASETDMVKQEEEYTEIKEQMYQDKLSNLKKQLQQLEDGIHPEFLKKLRKLEQIYQDRLVLNDVFRVSEMDRVDREFAAENKAAAKEFDEKKIELRVNLISDFEEKKRLIEVERCTMELTGDKRSLLLADLASLRRHMIEDSMEVKPVTTRKLRRRPNDPLPLPEKRRKTSPAQLNYLLEDNEIVDDLKILSRGKFQAPSKRHDREIRSLQRQLYLQASSNSGEFFTGDNTSFEVKVEDGKLYYDKKWFHRGQPIYFEGKEAGTRNSGIISTISSSEIWIKRTSDSSKIRIYISQLQKGKYTIRRRLL